MHLSAVLDCRVAGHLDPIVDAVEERETGRTKARPGMLIATLCYVRSHFGSSVALWPPDPCKPGRRDHVFLFSRVFVLFPIECFFGFSFFVCFIECFCFIDCVLFSRVFFCALEVLFF